MDFLATKLDKMIYYIKNALKLTNFPKYGNMPATIMGAIFKKKRLNIYQNCLDGITNH